MSGGQLLRLRGIRKSFGPVLANDSVDFELAAGEVHALVGENGAGKTTLMRVLYGLHRPDAGDIAIDGAPAVLTSPARAIGYGIGMVHQHFMLVPSFTVAENVTLGSEPGGGGLYRAALAARRTREVMTRLELDLDPAAVTGDLTVATQQKVEILKVLYRGARILILDEPTAVLTPSETRELFALLRALADGGTGVVFISHKLPEVFAVADRVTVLRQGRTVLSRRTGELSTEEVVTAMTGRSDVYLGRVDRESPTDAPTVLRVDGLCTEPAGADCGLDSVSLRVRAGEIVGVAGVDGNGQTALAESLVGLRAARAGRITLNGAEISADSVRERRDLGLGFVPEDRHLQGIPLHGTAAEGLAAGRIRRVGRLRALSAALPVAVRDWARDTVRGYAIAVPDIDAACRAMSGGNQQKIVLARELEETPACLVLAQPTRGVDIGAIEYLYGKVAQATARGCAVLLISADLDEIFRLSDRVVVLFKGRAVAELDTRATTRDEVGGHMMGLAG
ncbi:MAG TPA: ABC transporter ATP-binding protein [Pseudonocardia sp.]|jgi:simple sugar transport system ATP-binding protein|nr:ABC transporter ATP-binding protein [Pseudonocardia sp.]